MPPMRVTAAYDSDNRPPSAFNSTQHTSPLMPKNKAGGGRQVALLAARYVGVDPARQDPAPDGVDHGAVQLIFGRAVRPDSALALTLIRCSCLAGTILNTRSLRRSRSSLRGLPAPYKWRVAPHRDGSVALVAPTSVTTEPSFFVSPDLAMEPLDNH